MNENTNDERRYVLDPREPFLFEWDWREGWYSEDLEDEDDDEEVS